MIKTRVDTDYRVLNFREASYSRIRISRQWDDVPHPLSKVPTLTKNMSKSYLREQESRYEERGFGWRTKSSFTIEIKNLIKSQNCRISRFKTSKVRSLYLELKGIR